MHATQGCKVGLIHGALFSTFRIMCYQMCLLYNDPVLIFIGCRQNKLKGNTAHFNSVWLWKLRLLWFSWTP